MAVLLRLIFVVPLVYMVSCAVAGFTIFAAWQKSGVVPESMEFDLVFGGVMVAMAFGTVAFPISLIGITIAEAFKIRSFVWFVFLGLISGYLLSLTLPELPALFTYQETFGRAVWQDLQANVSAYLAGGSAFGLIYWLLVGRHSGFEKNQSSQRVS